MALAYTAPTWTDGSGEGISASNLQAISNCIEGLVQGSDKAVHNVQINGSVITLTYADGTVENFTAVDIKSISSIAKTSTVGLVDTYTITYSDGTTSTFTVKNGQDGAAIVTIDTTGTASSSDARYQRVGIDGVYTEIDGTKYMETTSYTTPSTGVRRFTFTNNVIRDSDNVDYRFSANVYGVSPTNVTIDTTGSTNVMMVDFNASDNVGKCRVYIRG